MKTALQLFIFILSFTTLSGQLVISEISYNPPESGADSLEYIELYNSTSSDIDLTDYVVRDNNPFTLSGGTVPANGYVVLASNPSAIMDILGISAIEVNEDFLLNNSGERIAIEDPSGTVIDEVTYSDDAPWPTFDDGTDGDGATIELCDLDSDNSEGSNWGVSTNDLGIIVNDKAFLGTPGAANTSSCEFVPDHLVEVTSNQFTPKDITINEGESVRWTNLGGFHNVNGSLAVYPDNPEGFTNGGASADAWVFDYTFTVPGVYDYQCDPHAGLGMVGTITVVGEVEPTIPTYDIGLVNTVDDMGVGDSLGTVCKLEGIVHGANLTTGGLQFALIDESGDGINVYSNNDLGYAYAEGDRVIMTGVITQFNGLLQIEPTEVEFVSANNDLIGPTMVSTLDESTESQLVQLIGLTIVNADDWGNEGGSFNVDFTDGTNVFTIRVDSDTEVADWMDPEFLDGMAVSITGIGGQYDENAPFLDGYQLFPRYNSDIQIILSADDIGQAEVNLYPNPVLDKLNIITDTDFENYSIYDNTGKTIAEGPYTNAIDVSRLNAGVYSISLIKGKAIKTVRFVK